MPSRRLFGYIRPSQWTPPLQPRQQQRLRPYTPHYHQEHAYSPYQHQPENAHDRYYGYNEYEAPYTAEPHQPPYAHEPYPSYGAYPAQPAAPYRPPQQELYHRPMSSTHGQHVRPPQYQSYETVPASQGDALHAMNTKLDAFMTRMERRMDSIEKENVLPAHTNSAQHSKQIEPVSHGRSEHETASQSTAGRKKKNFDKLDIGQLLWNIISSKSCNKRNLSIKLNADPDDVAEGMRILEGKRYLSKKLHNKGYSIRSAYLQKNVRSSTDSLVLLIQDQTKWGPFDFAADCEAVDLSIFEEAKNRKRVLVKQEDKSSPPAKKLKPNAKVVEIVESENVAVEPQHEQPPHDNHNHHEHGDDDKESDKVEASEQEKGKEGEKEKEKYEYHPAQHPVQQ